MYLLNNKGCLTSTTDIWLSNEDLIERRNNPNASILKSSSSEEFKKIRARILQIEQEKMELKIKNDPKYLKELSQEIIDQYELTIFNVVDIPDQNKTLYIFIDKDFSKKYFLSEFKFTFYISNKSGVVNNSFIVPFDPKVHGQYEIHDFALLKTLKYAINENHKRFMKGEKA